MKALHIYLNSVASQINQCAFCIRMHAQDALKTGESAERIAPLNAWRETEL